MKCGYRKSYFNKLILRDLGIFLRNKKGSVVSWEFVFCVLEVFVMTCRWDIVHTS